MSDLAEHISMSELVENLDYDDFDLDWTIGGQTFQAGVIGDVDEEAFSLRFMLNYDL